LDIDGFGGAARAGWAHRRGVDLMARFTPVRVALVPYKEPLNEHWMDPRDLLQVAAALQTQAVRDLYPIWKASAVISPFLDLTDVPPDYAAIVILPADIEFPGPSGFHILDGPTPVAIVKHGDDWSLLASHELMEMVCDPEGMRTEPGPPLKDGGERVDYLVEVCDACQRSTYTVDGVLVSDFVVPEYYGQSSGAEGLYSFTGRITRPRQLLEGGYVTWRTQAPDEAIWQAFAPPGTTYPPNLVPDDQLTIGPLLPAGLSREWIDAHPPTSGAVRPGPNSRLQNSQPLRDAQVAYENAGLAATRNGTDLHDLISAIVDKLNTRFTLNETETKDLLSQLTDPDGRAAFAADPTTAVAKTVNGPLAAQLKAPPNPTPAPAERYAAALNTFSEPGRFGTDFSQLDLPDLVSWMCYLGGF
jgi:hypothetical protein